MSIDKAGLAISIVHDHPDVAYISSRLGIADLFNKLLGRNNANADPTDDLSAEFERLRQCVNLGNLDALDKILKFNLEAPVVDIQSKIMHLMNEAEYNHLFAVNNVRNKGRLLSLHTGWASGYLTALPLPYFGLTLPSRYFQRVIQFWLGLKTCLTVRCSKCRLHAMDPYGNHAVTWKHGLCIIHCHDYMPYVQNIIANEASLKSRLEKTGLIVGRKDRPADVLLPMFCAEQDTCLDSMITHPLQPTFIDRAAGKSLVAAKVAAAKKHFDDDEKCWWNGLRLIAMAWEMFNGSALETRIMIRKIAIRHTDKHNNLEDRPSTRSINAFPSAPAWRWGATDCLQVCRLNDGFTANTSDS